MIETNKLTERLLMFVLLKIVFFGEQLFLLQLSRVRSNVKLT